MDHEQFIQPLLHNTNSSSSSAVTTATILDDNDTNNIKFFSSNTSIIFRLLFISFIGVISLWANYEASKGFDVTIINDAKDSPEGKRFDLLYVSNDKATRILLNTSAFIENILYADDKQTKKNVRSVTLRFTRKNTTQMATVETTKSDEFVINISSSIMSDTNANVNHAIISAIQRGMARIWLWHGESKVPSWLIDGLVEYISLLAGFRGKNFATEGESPEFSQRCWDDEFLNKGFIRRLNQAMKDHGDNWTMDDALGIKVKYLFDSYKRLS